MKVTTPISTSVEIPPLEAAFHDFIVNDHYPCIMAQTVFRTGNYRLKSYKDLGTEQLSSSLLNDLSRYLEAYNFENNDFFTFIAAFPDEGGFSEEEFESKLWKQLQYLHNADNVPWDPTVSHEPESSTFSFSLLGKAFYIVGLHPDSSRISRRSPCPAIVFNLHFQFQKLREMGTYETIRDKIRDRDTELQGSVNPMLNDFGKESEARQYSGRAVGEGWKCPFHAK